MSLYIRLTPMTPSTAELFVVMGFLISVTFAGQGDIKNAPISSYGTPILRTASSLASRAATSMGAIDGGGGFVVQVLLLLLLAASALPGATGSTGSADYQQGLLHRGAIPVYSIACTKAVPRIC